MDELPRGVHEGGKPFADPAARVAWDLFLPQLQADLRYHWLQLLLRHWMFLYFWLLLQWELPRWF